MKIFKDDQDKKTIIATTKEVEKSGVYESVKTWVVHRKNQYIDIKHAFEIAGKHEITSILVEGGSGLATSLIRRKLVDKLYLVIAPVIIGRGIEAVGDLGITKVARALRFHESGFEPMGIDSLFWGYPED
jgi:riboflavin biosynthesis pyrimidine reductase